MEPVTTALVLAAITNAASSMGSEAGRGVWGSLARLSNRVLRRGAQDDGGEPVVRPDDEARLAALADLLVQRAREDREFAADLTDWLADARTLPAAAPSDEVHNTIGGTARISGNVLQARDISGPITFGTPPPAAS